MATTAEAIAFGHISQEWIQRLFALTDADRPLLNDPLGRIVEPGGDVLIARQQNSSEIIGCVALIAYPDHFIELSKMAVAPAAQGHGVGRLLVTAAIKRASELQGRRRFRAPTPNLPQQSISTTKYSVASTPINYLSRTTTPAPTS